MLTAISTAFHKGGWGMWPILFTSVVTIAIIVERAVYLFRASASAIANCFASSPLTALCAYISRAGSSTMTATTVRTPRSTNPTNRGSFIRLQTP